MRLVNAHTGETFEGTYRDEHGPIGRVMDELCIFLRDYHTGEKVQIDIGVIDFLADVLAAVGETKATILSAYRTSATNTILARTTFGVAEHSQHIYGPALDFHLDSKLAEAMSAAREAKRGGVAGTLIRASYTSIPGRCGIGISMSAGWIASWNSIRVSSESGAMAS